MAHNMVFTQGRGFVVGASFGLQISLAPLSRFGLPRRGHRLFGNVVSFGKLLGVSITYGFGEKRCRKNLPLSVTNLPDSAVVVTILLLSLIHI